MAAACGGGSGSHSGTGTDDNSPDGTYGGDDSPTTEFDSGLGSVDSGGTPENETSTPENDGSMADAFAPQEAGQVEAGGNDATTDGAEPVEAGGSGEAGADGSTSVEAGGGSEAGTDGSTSAEAGGSGEAGTDGGTSVEAGGSDGGNGEAGGADSGTNDGGVTDAGADSGSADAATDAAPDAVAPATYTLGGSVSNLGAGNTVTLQNGTDVLPVTTGTFTFDVALANAATYLVTVTSVTGPVPQTCAVSAGAMGAVAGANVTSVVVTCTNTYSVGGTLAGLTVGESIVLDDLAGDVLTLTQNGPFTLQTPVANGATYGVSIQTTPSSPIVQTCTLSNEGGTMGAAAVTNVSVDCDMLAYFPFTGNANDASGYGNNGVITNATLTTDHNGAANGAYAFNGTGYIEAAMPTGFLPNGDASRTLTAWLQPTQDIFEWGVVYWGTGNCTGLQFGIGDQGGDQATFWGGCDDFESGLLVPVSTMATPAWTFVAVVYSQDATTTITVYVNGTSTQGTITDLNTPTASNFVMGADLINNVYFVGNLDSIRVYGHALSATEVGSIYMSTAP
jgi:hypothetical protein